MGPATNKKLYTEKISARDVIDVKDTLISVLWNLSGTTKVDLVPVIGG
jgi:hypothetical protein